MAYTNFPWVNNIPAGSDPANTADDQFRQLRLDVQERQNDIVEDWAGDDPVAVKTRNKHIHWTAGVPFGSGATWTSVTGVSSYVNPLSAPGSLHWLMAIPHLPGATITEIVALIGRAMVADTVQFIVSRMNAAGAISAVAAATAAITGTPQELSSGVLAEVMAADEYYWFDIQLAPFSTPSNARFYGIRIEYTLAFALQGF